MKDIPDQWTGHVIHTSSDHGSRCGESQIGYEKPICVSKRRKSVEIEPAISWATSMTRTMRVTSFLSIIGRGLARVLATTRGFGFTRWSEHEGCHLIEEPVPRLRS